MFCLEQRMVFHPRDSVVFNAHPGCILGRSTSVTVANLHSAVESIKVHRMSASSSDFSTRKEFQRKIEAFKSTIRCAKQSMDHYFQKTKPLLHESKEGPIQPHVRLTRTTIATFKIG